MKAIPCELAEIGARMRVARESLGLGQAEFATKYDVVKVTYGRNELGKNEAGVCLLSVFIRAGINANWLLTGEGPMKLSDLVNQDELQARLAQVQPEPPDIDQQLLRVVIENIYIAAPRSTPEKVAREAAEFYARLIAMRMEKSAAA